MGREKNGVHKTRKKKSLRFLNRGMGAFEEKFCSKIFVYPGKTLQKCLDNHVAYIHLRRGDLSTSMLKALLNLVLKDQEKNAFRLVLTDSLSRWS